MNKMIFAAVACFALAACKTEKTVPADTSVVKSADTSVVSPAPVAAVDTAKDTVVKTTTENTKVLHGKGKGKTK